MKLNGKCSEYSLHLITILEHLKTTKSTALQSHQKVLNSTLDLLTVFSTLLFSRISLLFSFHFISFSIGLSYGKWLLKVDLICINAFHKKLEWTSFLTLSIPHTCAVCVWACTCVYVIGKRHVTLKPLQNNLNFVEFERSIEC